MLKACLGTRSGAKFGTKRAGVKSSSGQVSSFYFGCQKFCVMIDSIMSSFINAAMSGFIGEVKKSDITCQIMKKRFLISELELYKFALFQYDLPVIIKHGVIQEIPWTSLKKDPIVVSVNNIFITAKFCCGDPSSVISEQELYDMRERQLHAHKSFKSKFESLIGLIPKSDSMSNAIVENLRVKMKNFHLRSEIEDGESAQVSDSVPVKSVHFTLAVRSFVP